MHFLRILIISFSLGLYTTAIFAQVSGYKGKRFILKTDLASVALERGYTFELESMLLRDFAISIDYASRAKLNFNDKQNLTDTLSYRGNTAGLKLRFYVNKGVPGPVGVYTFLSFRYGSVDIDANYNPDSRYVPRVQSYEKQRFSQYGLGWGIQKVFADRISLDTGWTFFVSHFDYYGPLPAHVARSYGENLFLLNKLFGYEEDHFGISIHVSVGVLL